MTHKAEYAVEGYGKYAYCVACNYDNQIHPQLTTAELLARVAELEAAIQAWNDATDFDEHTKAVRVLQGLAK